MKSYTVKLVTVTSALVLLGGCVTDGNQYTWVKSSADNVERERAVAESECLAEAHKTFAPVPMPNNSCVGNCINNNRGISNGFLVGSAAKQNREIREAREQFYESCMLGKGWKKQSM